MVAVSREGGILHIGDALRVEPGPRRVEVSKATAEVLSDEVTAPHYAVGNMDSDGTPIEIGKPMVYLDWLGHQDGREGSTTFYAYRLEKMTAAEIKQRLIEGHEGWDDLTDEQRDELSHIWREIGQYPSEEAAMTALLSAA